MWSLRRSLLPTLDRSRDHATTRSSWSCQRTGPELNGLVQRRCVLPRKLPRGWSWAEGRLRLPSLSPATGSLSAVEHRGVASPRISSHRRAWSRHSYERRSREDRPFWSRRPAIKLPQNSRIPWRGRPPQGPIPDRPGDRAWCPITTATLAAAGARDSGSPSTWWSWMAKPPMTTNRTPYRWSMATIAVAASSVSGWGSASATGSRRCSRALLVDEATSCGWRQRALVSLKGLVVVVERGQRHPELEACGSEDAFEGGEIGGLRAALVRGDRRLCRAPHLGELRLGQVSLQPCSSNERASAVPVHIVEYIPAALDLRGYTSGPGPRAE